MMKKNTTKANIKGNLPPNKQIILNEINKL